MIKQRLPRLTTQVAAAIREKKKKKVDEVKLAPASEDQCMICLNDASDMHPEHLCTNGHQVCKECFPRLLQYQFSTCPKCRQPMISPAPRPTTAADDDLAVARIRIENLGYARGFTAATIATIIMCIPMFAYGIPFVVANLGLWGFFIAYVLVCSGVQSTALSWYSFVAWSRVYVHGEQAYSLQDALDNITLQLLPSSVPQAAGAPASAPQVPGVL